ncbi:Protein of unknown function [Roseovarius azorensis]|uniref:DUF1203 domain-containing protein n=1 Tax=Roseovarius azorensis TaxID=1287727 RepID=A0A1H7PM80_9RHOB|nr:DUF1203 domain-containing protein [Roseovarius azorensis]SEL36534.1 Protein of unknown function [Roseovarius azorensis]
MITFTALPTPIARAWQAGAPDAYGNPPERHVAQGTGNPCRHCLRFIPEGAGMLILAHRPFDGLHPYAETGPIFLCADACPRHEGAAMPEILRDSPDYLLKGYNAQDRIVYGTGRVVAAADVAGYAQAVFERSDVAYIHVRSARNNCYQARIDRG